MKKFLLFFCLTMCGFAIQSNAQHGYKSAIGVRLGSPMYFNASYKTFISDAGALEFAAGLAPYTYYFGAGISASYQHHFPIKAVENLSWYVGGGPIVTFWSYDDLYVTDGKNFSIGVFALGGVDWKIPKIPLNVSADVGPYFNFIRGGISNFGFYGGASARYILN